MGETATGAVEQAVDPGGIVDTDILVDALRAVPEAIAFLRDAERYLTVAAITQMELLQGCRNMAELHRVEQFLRRFAVRGLSELIGGISVSFMRRYRLSHGLLLPDALIAATALEHDVTLYTKNVRHFQMIPGLTVVRPY
jgi:predicted nucleic acid-binding protein